MYVCGLRRMEMGLRVGVECGCGYLYFLDFACDSREMNQYG